MVDLAAQSKDLGALALLSTHGGKPIRALDNDLGDIGIGFHVIQDGGLAEQTLDCGEGRTGTGLAALALDGGHQSGLLTADEGAGTQTQADIKAEAGAENILAQQAILMRLPDSRLQMGDSQRILRTNINITLIGTDGIAGDGHGLQHRMGVAFQNRAIHECAGVALIGVAADVLLHVAAVAGSELPLHAGRETCAAAAADAGIQHRLNDLVGGHLGQHLAQPLIAAASNVFINIFRIDHAAVAQGDANLLFIKRCICQSGHGSIIVIGRILIGIGHGVFAQSLTVLQVLLCHLFCLFGSHFNVSNLFLTGRQNLHNGLILAQADTAGGDQLHLVGNTQRFTGLFQRVHHLAGAGSQTAGGHTHQNAGFLRSCGALTNGIFQPGLHFFHFIQCQFHTKTPRPY